MGEVFAPGSADTSRRMGLGRITTVFGSGVEPAVGPRRNGEAMEWFTALPSLSRVRWLAPLRGFANGSAALGVYEPWRWRARMFKFALTRAMRYGWRGRARDRVGIPEQQWEPLRRLVRSSTGREAALFSVSLGADNRVAKVTVQALDAEGQTLGFFKAGLTAAAERRVRHEAGVLQRLAAIPALRDAVPAVLATGSWNGRYVLFQAPVGEERGPEKFAREHADFLARLQRVAPSSRSPEDVADEVEARWTRVCCLAPASWRIAVSAAIDRARRLLGGEPVPCGPAHGDFAPWNTRRAGGRLTVFDWELAQWAAPSGWDRLHFLVQWDSLVHPRWRPEKVLEKTCGDARATGLSLLYLVDSASRLAEEGLPWGDSSMRYRRQALELSVGGGKLGAGRFSTRTVRVRRGSAQ